MSPNYMGSTEESTKFKKYQQIFFFQIAKPIFLLVQFIKKADACVRIMFYAYCVSLDCL